MANRTKVLVIDSDLDTLSKIYLTLVHRGYKPEASDKISELGERLKRFKPALLILGFNEYQVFRETLKIPVLVSAQPEEMKGMMSNSELTFLSKPFSADGLIETIQQLVI